MFVRLLKTARSVVLVLAAACGAIGWGSTPAYAQCCSTPGDHSGHQSNRVIPSQLGGHTAGHAGHGPGSIIPSQSGSHLTHPHGAAALAPVPPKPPHGGQFTLGKTNCFEVVYLPQEIRVYLYGRSYAPVSMRNVRGRLTLRLRGETEDRQRPLQYVAPPVGSSDQDYLTATVETSRLVDGETKIHVALENIVERERPKAAFTQVFTRSAARPQVTVVSLAQGDQAGIARQATCPVTGARLGSMGDPIKVLVGGQPLYLCCKGCLGQVQSAPEAYLRSRVESPSQRND